MSLETAITILALALIVLGAVFAIAGFLAERLEREVLPPPGREVRRDSFMEWQK